MNQYAILRGDEVVILDIPEGWEVIPDDEPVVRGDKYCYGDSFRLSVPIAAGKQCEVEKPYIRKIKECS